MAFVAPEPRRRLADGEDELAPRVAVVELPVEVAAVPGPVLEGLEAVGDGEDRRVVAALECLPELRIPARVPEAEQDERAPERARAGSRGADPEDLLVASLAHGAADGESAARERQATHDARGEGAHRRSA